ncbi:hypothetical protein [Aquimarina litoralis]|uniref:hypothetical protein n=1 Tax=Aquimarina litoralis TaxID=584605 RepID=UPI001C5729DF|nr:hypothetical protein [Aquimarina litoralis]MBW1297616.1 hypothetical protein [Aquimarina litoralis]
MKNEFEALQHQWQKDKSKMESDPKENDMEQVLSTFQKNKTWSTNFQYGNIIILSIVLVGISAFFYFVAPVEELLSRIGVGLMIGGLFVRIIIECISVSKTKKINMLDQALQTTEDTIAFYKFRRKIHGPITILIIALYTIGFYMISPEFSLYFETWQMILIDGSYVIGAIILILVIRKNVKKEIKILSDIVDLKKKMLEEIV